MNTLLLSLPLLLFLVDWATLSADTTISRVVQGLEWKEAEALTANRYEEFPYGSCSGVILPSNAPPQAVVMEAIQQNGWTTNGVAVVATQMVHIRPPQGLEKLIVPADLPGLLDRRAHKALTAVLLKTPGGERVVLMEFMEFIRPSEGTRWGAWFHETFDPVQIVNEDGGANGRQQSSSETNRTSGAAAPLRSP